MDNSHSVCILLTLPQAHFSLQQLCRPSNFLLSSTARLHQVSSSILGLDQLFAPLDLTREVRSKDSLGSTDTVLAALLWLSFAAVQLDDNVLAFLAILLRRRTKRELVAFVFGPAIID